MSKTKTHLAGNKVVFFLLLLLESRVPLARKNTSKILVRVGTIALHPRVVALVLVLDNYFLTILQGYDK